MSSSSSSSTLLTNVSNLIIDQNTLNERTEFGNQIWYRYCRQPGCNRDIYLSHAVWCARSARRFREISSAHFRVRPTAEVEHPNLCRTCLLVETMIQQKKSKMEIQLALHRMQIQRQRQMVKFFGVQPIEPCIAQAYIEILVRSKRTPLKINRPITAILTVPLVKEEEKEKKQSSDVVVVPMADTILSFIHQNYSLPSPIPKTPPPSVLPVVCYTPHNTPTKIKPLNL